MKKSEYMQLGEKFRNFFGKSLNLNNYCEILPNGELTFDIFAFECFLIGYGYNDEVDGSMNDYVKKEFGEDASKFIEYLLD